MPVPGDPVSPAGRIGLSVDQRKELTLEVATIIDEHKADTMEYLRQTIIQRRLYELKSRRKNWPWPGAANFMVPLIRFAVDYYKGRIKRIFKQAGNQLWHGSNRLGKEKDDATGFDWKQIAEDAAAVSNYLTSDPSHIDIQSFLDDAIDFISKDGTSPVKVHYVSRTKPRWVRNPNSNKLDRIEEPYEERVRWDPVDVIHHVWTVNGSNPDDMPVIGHWMEMTRGQLVAFGIRNGIAKDRLDRVIKSPDTPWFLDEERILDEEMGIRRDQSVMSKTLNIYRIYELNVEFALKEDEPPALLTVWYHHGTQTILEAFNPEDFATSWEVLRFIKRGRQYLGAGISEALRVLNLGANAVFNQTVDAQTVANAYGFLYKADSSAANFIANANLFPGVKIPVDEDVTTEFKTFQLGEGGNPGSIGLMNFILQMTEMISKVSSDLGQVSAGKRVAASVGMHLAQEGDQMIDAVVSGVTEVVERMQIRSLFLYANHQPEVFDAVLPPDRATNLLAAIRDPSAAFPLRVKISLNISSATASKEKDKQDLIVLANFLFNVFNKILEQGAVITNPQAPPEFKQMVAFVYKGMSEVSKRLIEAFEQFKDPDAALPAGILALFEGLAGASAGPANVFPRVEGAESLGPAAVGPAGPEAAGPLDLLQGLGGI